MPTTPPLEKFVDPLPRPMTAISDHSVYPGADYYEATIRRLALTWLSNGDATGCAFSTLRTSVSGG
ncbi:hypothetical protein ACH40F_48360 [Streptomyces sp. NPDC020794]|uniref:hypothetical protein n=1 Tax=unclassified Streptomyces TaxID=2593676 RepID=UPI0036EE955F